MHEDHYAKLLSGQTIRISDDHAFTCVYQGKTMFQAPCGTLYKSLRQFMLANWKVRGKTTTNGDAWKYCEKQLPDGKWVKCKKQVSVVAAPVAVAEPVAAEPVAAEPVAAEPVAAEPVAAEPVTAEPVAAEPATAEETQLLLLNEVLQKQLDAIQKEKDIVVQRLKLIQTKREIERIDADIQLLQERRQMLLRTLPAEDHVSADVKNLNKELLKPYVERVLDKLLDAGNNNNMSKFLAPIAELFVSDDLKQKEFIVCEAKNVCGLGASHDLEIMKQDGTTVKVQVKGRADKNWGFLTGKKPYLKNDFDLLAYLHYENMGDLSSAKLWYFPAEALMSTDTTMKTKVPVKVLEKYCNKEAQEKLLCAYF